MNAAASYVSFYFGLKGPNITFNHRAISADNAVGYGADLIRDGKADQVLVGGMDGLGPTLFNHMDALGLLSPMDGGREGIFPYDRGANGLCLGEGAGILVLEEQGHAMRRGAEIYAEVEAYAIRGSRAPVYGWTWDGEGVERAVARILEQVGIGLERIDGVIGSGCGLPALDAAELDALRRLFRGSKGTPFLYSPKSLMGDFDGMGGLKAIAGALSISEQRAWPNLFAQGPLAHDPLELPDALQARRIERLLIVGMAAGGAGSGLLLRRPGAGR
jgi:3-oxoacyl-(acyl-carrier-protein) synthase